MEPNHRRFSLLTVSLSSPILSPLVTLIFSGLRCCHLNATSLQRRVPDAGCRNRTSSGSGYHLQDATMSFENAHDRLSRLPEDIISYILSLMPTKYAMQTSILSKTWRYTWMLVTNLDFENINNMDSLHSLTPIVDRALNSFTRSQLKLFRIHFPIICPRRSRVSNWIDKAVELKVCELDIKVELVQLSISMFTCMTLTKLKLHHSARDNSFWKFSWPINLPSLKTLDIYVFSCPFDNAYKLINGCPILECLSMKVTKYTNEEDFIYNIPTLKRLELRLRYPFAIHKVILKVPKLEYLFVGGSLSSFFVMEDVSSLVEACVSVRYVSSDHLWFKLLKGINGVKSLLIQHKNTFSFKIPVTSSLLTYLSTTHLELKNVSEYRLISQLLIICPELKHLSVEEKHNKMLQKSSWIKPKLVPACMLTNLTTIKFLNCNGHLSDMQFLEYVLGKAEVLKTVTITWENLSMEEEMLLCAQLLKIPRASQNCEIHFLGNYSLRLQVVN